MKILSPVVACCLAGSLFFSSCVSNRKYKEAISGRDNLQQKYDNLQADNDRLQKENQQLQTSRQTAINEKETALNEEKKKLQDMKSLIDAQRDAIRNLKKEVCSALKCFTPDELTIEVRDGKLYVSLSDKLLFPSGSDMVNDRGKEAISMLGAVLANSDLEVMIEGHTDTVPIHTGRNKDNWDLSVHRATSVSRILMDNGLSANRIIASGRSKFHPIASNETAQGRQLNRRTEIVLAPKLDKLWKLTEQEDIPTAETKQ